MESQEPLYFVTLEGVTDAALRAQLEEAFRAEMDRRFGGERNVAEAIVCASDTARDEHPGDRDGLTWPEAAREVEEVLLQHLTPVQAPRGARFLCMFNNVALGMHMDPSLPGEYLFYDAIGGPPTGVTVVREDRELIAKFPACDGEPAGELRVRDMQGNWRSAEPGSYKAEAPLGGFRP